MAAVPQARGQSVTGPTSVCLNPTSGMVYAGYYPNQGPGLCTVTSNSGWTVSSNGTIESTFTWGNNINGGIKVLWKSGGMGTVTARLEPLCRDITINVYVGPLAGSISGPQYIQCDAGGNATYTIAADPAATKTWTAASTSGTVALTFVSNAGNTATFKIDPSNGPATGTISCTVTHCGTTTTKTFPVYRQTPPGGISGSSSICVGSYGSYTTAPGSNHVWSVSSSSFSVRGAGNYATVDAYYTGSALLRVTYNRICDNVLVTDMMPINGVSCGYGTMAIAPNPATDIAEISYTDESQEYEVKVYNSFNKVVAAGKVRKGKLLLRVGALPEGLYYVRLSNGKTVVATGRLLKK